MTLDRHVMVNLAAIAQNDILADHAERSDLDVFADLGTGTDHTGRMNAH